MQEIFIYTGPIHTGKTTKLMQWASSQKNIDGIFQPVIEKKRFIYHIASRTLKPLETNDSHNTVSIGNYKFSSETFMWSKNVLLENFKKNFDWLIIDEIGPLELDGKGLEPAFSEIINERENLGGKILCVVRDTLLEKFLAHYKLKDNFKMFELPL